MSNIGTAATGKVLQGGGTGSSPTFSTATYPATATGTGKILRADGTNWAASTATYPDTAGTSGNVLTSDGTNWTSSAPSAGAILTAEVKLTSAQIKALHATPIAIVATPGSGKVIMVVNAIGRFTYGGTNAFTAGASQSIDVNLGTAAAGKYFTLLANVNVTSTTSGYCYNAPSVTLLGATASFENQPLNLYNPVATEITGNAGNNNTFDVSVAYYIVTLT